MARYHGGKAAGYMSTSGSGNAAPVIALSQWTLDMSTDKVEVTAFGDANKQYVQGLKDIKGTLAAYFDDTADPLFDGADSSDGVKLYLYPSSLVPTNYHYGPAWIDASITVDVNGAVTLKANYIANGSWGRKPS